MLLPETSDNASIAASAFRCGLNLLVNEMEMFKCRRVINAG